jgi:dipeptidyl aminopeptidase/acylaminoacyl peptidase
MKDSILRLALPALLLATVLGAPPADARPFTARDLVMLDRLSDPQLAPDGHAVVYTLRQTNFDANGAERSLWKLELADAGALPQRLTATGSNAWSARWSPDGRVLYFLSSRSGSDQVWALDQGMGEARQVTRLPLDVDGFRLSPDGRRLALSMAVFTDCKDLACTQKRLGERSARKASGMRFDQMFVRHWDQWADGRRSQLFVAVLDGDGTVHAEPHLVSSGIEGDVPSKPFGDESEFGFSPDGATLYFNARVAGAAEPWSTNFDIYAAAVDGDAAPRNLTADNPAWDGYPLAAPDGRHLYYLAMKRPMHEADRFGIVELDLATGKRREVDPGWDRSAGPLHLSADGRTLYTGADDQGEHPLFAIDVASGQVRRLAAAGNVGEASFAGARVVFARDSLTAPADLYLLEGGKERRLTQVNAARLSGVAMGEVEEFHFKGWNGERVRGYVVKPAGFESGRKYPVAFLIHGGPQGSWLNDFHYRWNPQTYAGAGYAVVAIDFHGSTGYGQAFTDAISGHWGDRPLEDLKAGWAAALAQYPFLSSERACALGASYGGYMINWIAGNWNGPWKCLVNHDGDFDERMGYYTTEELWFDEVEKEGLPWEKPGNFERFNPADHVADWKVPMLVVHGAKDYRVPLEHGLATFTALQRRGIPSELLVFPDENHWVLKPQNSLQWNETVLEWLGRWTR